MVNHLGLSLPSNSVSRLTERLDLNIVDWAMTNHGDKIFYLFYQSADGETCMHDAIVQEEVQPLITQAVLNAQNADYSIPNEKGFNVLKWAALKNNQA